MGVEAKMAHTEQVNPLFFPDKTGLNESVEPVIEMFDQMTSGDVVQYLGGAAAGTVLYVVSWNGDHQDWLREGNTADDMAARMKQNAYAAGLGTAGIEGVHDGYQYLVGGEVPDVFYDDWITFAGVATGFTVSRAVHRRVSQMYNLRNDEPLLEE
jgi:hypothetical protein